jgi:hypothetical protein
MSSVSDESTNRAHVRRLLRQLGVRYSFGISLGELTERHFEVADEAVASVLADAAGRVLGGYGLAILPGPILHLSSKPGGTSDVAVARSVMDLAEILAPLAVAPSLVTQAVGIDFDLDAPLLGADGGAVDAVGLPPVAVNAVRLGGGIDAPLLCGPGVIRHGTATQAIELARALGGGLFNTYGAKGLLRWEDPMHGATLGLQAADFELAGCGPGRVVVVSGVDTDEVGAALDGAQVIEIHPLALGAAIDPSRGDMAPGPAAPARTPLYRDLAAVLRPEYEAASLTTPRLASQLVASMPREGIVVTDAGSAGFWLGRTAPTSVAGSVVIPSLSCEGFAAAGAVVAGLDGRPAIGVLNLSPDSTSLQIIEHGRRWGAPASLQCLRPGQGGGDPVVHKRATDRQWRRLSSHLAGRLGDEDSPDIDTFDADDTVQGALEALAGPRRAPFV